MKLKDRLSALGACNQALAWVGDQTPAEAWAACRQVDWMIWAIDRAKPADYDRRLRLMAADCAEAVLPLFEARHPDDMRPRLAIQAARDYAEGRISAAAWAAAWDAAWAAQCDIVRQYYPEAPSLDAAEAERT